MGRPSSAKRKADLYRDEPSHDDGASMSSAMSMHSNMGYEREEEQDEADLPPYSDEAQDATAPLLDSRSYDQPPLLRDTKVDQYHTCDYQKGRKTTRLSPVLSTDPIALKAYLLEQAKEELQARVLITGTHEETHETRNGKEKTTKKEKVVDFSFYIDVTDTISRRRSGQPCWSELAIVDNERKTYRGGRIKSRDKRFKIDVENTHSTASIDEWCHLFCASSSKLKTFTMRRIITERDEKALNDSIMMIVRGTRYRGHVDINFPTYTRAITVASPHLFHRLYNNKFFYWACIILQLWIITWPILFFMTKRWDILEVTFPFKKIDQRTGTVEYVQDSEQEWCSKWSYSISQACRMKVNPQRCNGDPPQILLIDDQAMLAQQIEQDKRAKTMRDALPQGGFMGGAMNLLRGGLAVAGEYNANQDWGFDT